MLWPFQSKARLPPSASVPPFHTQHRQLCVSASAVGLVVRPFDSESSEADPPYVGPAIKINWRTEGREDSVEELQEWKEDAGEGRLVVEAVAGLLHGFQDSFAIFITEGTQVATAFDEQKRIFTVDALLSIPLDLLAARTLITNLGSKQRPTVHKARSVSTEEGTEDDEAATEGEGEGIARDDASHTAEPAGAALPTGEPAAAGTGQTVEAGLAPTSTPVATRPTGRRPFWKKSRQLVPQVVATSIAESLAPAEPLANDTEATDLPTLAATATSPVEDKYAIDSRRQLDAKIVGETLRSMKGLYFSFDFDITHSLQRKYEIATSSTSPSASERASNFVEPLANLPLWRRADKRFWWNSYLMKAFVKAGVHSYVVVLQQGFVQESSITLPLPTDPTLDLPADDTAAPPSSITLNLLLIARRSVERPGLRYQRRGTDSEGGVANFVESEFLSACSRDEKVHISSFVQTRGSIPIFWSQTPWALKPPPVLERTPEESLVAITRHFDKQVRLYGKQIVVNLAEQTGKEAVVVDAYEAQLKVMGKEELVKYVGWDFHAQTHGMKYENISKLTDQLQADLRELDCFWATNDSVFTTQTGVCRTNCIDCLDRTNVVQSAICRWTLNQHLVRLGLSAPSEDGNPLDAAMMDIWANLGDAISREYAGTSALKGDFTRTGKRNWRGAVNDASNSVARLLQSTVTDFFKQAVLDYIMGQNLAAFSEFQERLNASDPGDILRLATIRKAAIETAADFVLSKGEERLAAWTVLSPSEPDQVRSLKYEENILLLSKEAVYVVSYDYSLQKVMRYTRILLGSIIGITRGPYFISALDAPARDPLENYGFKLQYDACSSIERTQTYSTIVKPSTSPPPAAVHHFFAFKALRRDMIRLASHGQSQIIDRSGDAGPGRTARDTVESIVGRLHEECEHVGAVAEGWLKEEDIISLAEAQASTGLLDQITYNIKSLIWL